jgi:hypothetical protein
LEATITEPFTLILSKTPFFQSERKKVEIYQQLVACSLSTTLFKLPQMTSSKLAPSGEAKVFHILIKELR